MDDYETQLAHLIKLASNPATKEHSWHMAKQLERCETGMWKGIAEELKQHMLAQNQKPSVSSCQRGPKQSSVRTSPGAPLLGLASTA